MNDEEDYDDILEATPKSGTLTVTQEEAKAIYDLVQHIWGPCWDDFEGTRRGKSMELMSKLRKVDDLLDKLMDYPEEEQGVYWTPYGEITVDETDPILLQEIGNRTGVKLYIASLFDVPSCAPIGHIQLALDLEVKEACGVFFVERAIGPEWLAAADDLNDTIQRFVEALPQMREMSAEDQV